MSGNSIGKSFVVTTWGESHGRALGVVIDGCPAGISISLEEIQAEVNRRKPQDPRISTPRKEEDKVEILSGIFDGKTTGAPISALVYNKDVRSKDYEKLKDVYRPGHADITYDLKYGNDTHDSRGGGRSSGRETVSRVIAGAVAKKLIKSLPEGRNTKIYGHTIQVGEIFAEEFNKNEVDRNPLRCPDAMAAKEMLKLIEETHRQGDSIGAVIEIIIENPQTGLGQPVFDKLDADLAKAFMSIGAVKGVEIGCGFDCALLRGSENNDQMEMKNGILKYLSNNSGGILGGISNGEPIIARLAIKPVPSISKTQKTVSKRGENVEIEILGRHDTCLAPRIIPVAESMAAITLADHLLRNS